MTNDEILAWTNQQRAILGKAPLATWGEYLSARATMAAERAALAQSDESDTDESDAEPTCSSCEGTGEGSHDGAFCWTCGGGGGQSLAARRAARAEHLADLGDD